VGLDLGDRESPDAVIDGEGVIVEERAVATTELGLRHAFQGSERCRFTLESALAHRGSAACYGGTQQSGPQHAPGPRALAHVRMEAGTTRTAEGLLVGGRES
jgi:hypothetical protein